MACVELRAGRFRASAGRNITQWRQVAAIVRRQMECFDEGILARDDTTVEITIAITIPITIDPADSIDKEEE